MTRVNLFNETGHNSQDERNTEALRYIEELEPSLEMMDSYGAKFVRDLARRRDENTLVVTGKQLFWLRDLYQKYVCEA